MRKTHRGSYSEENLWKAIEAVKGGTALKPIVIAYEISIRALQKHRDGKVKQP